MPGDPGETWSALTFSLNRVDRADGTTPLSNVSVANEIVADCRLFPLRQINFDTPEKPYSSSTYQRQNPGRWFIADAPPKMTACVRRTVGEAERLGRKRVHPVKRAVSGLSSAITLGTRHAKSIQPARACERFASGPLI